MVTILEGNNLGRNYTVQGCEAIIAEVIRQRFVSQIDERTLGIIIKETKGGDPRTVKNWLSNLLDLGYVERLRPFLYRVNLLKVPALLNETVRQGQTKLL